jgi:hypothetical protein
MLLLESNARFLPLRLRSHTVTETIIRQLKEKRVCLTKERTSIEQVFVMLSLFLSLSLARLPPFSSSCRPYRQRRQIIWMHACMLVRIELWLSGRVEWQYDRTGSRLVLIFLYSIYPFIHPSIYFLLVILM